MPNCTNSPWCEEDEKCCCEKYKKEVEDKE